MGRGHEIGNDVITSCVCFSCASEYCCGYLEQWRFLCLFLQMLRRKKEVRLFANSASIRVQLNRLAVALPRILKITKNMYTGNY